MPTSLQITDSYLWYPYANCSSSRRVNSGFIINAIAATFMNSSADSVDLLQKALSTINKTFEECRFPAPVYSHLVILSHFNMLRSVFSVSLWKCATKMGLNVSRGGDSDLGDGLFKSDVVATQDGCALSLFSVCLWGPAAAPQLESPLLITRLLWKFIVVMLRNNCFAVMKKFSTPVFDNAWTNNYNSSDIKAKTNH